MRNTSVGQSLFAATMIGIGILGLIKGDFVVVWQPVPGSVPAREGLAFLCAFIPLACGIGLLWWHTAATAARVFLAYLVLWFLVFPMPRLLRGLSVDVYWSASRTAVMLAAVWVLYVWLADDWDRQHLGFATRETGLRFARALYGLAIIPFGLAHFQYVAHTAAMVPRWLPAPVAWVYFTGAAFIAAGLAILIGAYARLAAALSALQMGLFLLLVWVPLLAAGPLNAFQWGEVVTTWTLTAAAWVVTDSYRTVPWLSVTLPGSQSDSVADRAYRVAE